MANSQQKKENGKKPRCFVVMPFGAKGSEEEREFKNIYTYLIKKTVENSGVECIRGDEIPESGIIAFQIKEKLHKTDLVIADLTNKNPNVLYEVGYRHALGKPIISIAQDVKGLPFDLAHYRTIAYDPKDMGSIAECETLMTKYIESTKCGLIDKTPTSVTSSLDASDVSIGVGIENIYRIMSDVLPHLDTTIESMNRISQKCRVAHNEDMLVGTVSKIDKLLDSTAILVQMSNLGLVGIHKNRLDAIEHYFFDVIRNESNGIDIVGSTIFGLKGYRARTFDEIMLLLQEKKERDGFQLRILLTHWDFISFRQEQEKTDKNFMRYVIAKELKEAVELIREKGMEKCLKFYRGSPTCFTIIAEGQKLMLVNPYPYQKEAYNSWCTVFRDSIGGVYADFKKAHFDEPWINPDLSVSYSDNNHKELLKFFQQSIDAARFQMAEQIAKENEEKPESI